MDIDFSKGSISRLISKFSSKGNIFNNQNYKSLSPSIIFPNLGKNAYSPQSSPSSPLASSSGIRSRQHTPLKSSFKPINPQTSKSPPKSPGNTVTISSTDSFSSIIRMINNSSSSSRPNGSTKPDNFRFSNLNNNNSKPVFSR